MKQPNQTTNNKAMNEIDFGVNPEPVSVIVPGVIKTLGDQLSYEKMIQAEIPARTNTYTPVPHQDIDTYVKSLTKELGFCVVDQEFRVNGKGNVAIGLYTLDRDCEERGMQFRFAWRNSYDKSRKLTIASGVRILVCSNGAFWGDNSNLSRKHQGELDMEFRDVVEREMLLADRRLNEGKAYEREWSENRLTKKQWTAMFGEVIMANKIITPTMLNPLREDLRHGPFRVERDGSHTRWGMYMNITHALKNVHPGEYIRLQKDAHTAMSIIRTPSFNLS